MEELQLTHLPEVFDAFIASWHIGPDDDRKVAGAVNPLARELARRNYELWHEEDTARRTDVDDCVIAAVKRRIDVLNQARNDMIERLDEQILAWLNGKIAGVSAADTNSETPGSVVDRISILSLKIFHMREDTLRGDVSQEHRDRSLQKLAILTEQRTDLFAALQQLISDYLAGRKRMKLYRQFKMYNDPELNPEIYRQQRLQG